jgi:iron complex outermembrane receptor protein
VAEGADDERAYTLFSSASYRGFTLEAAHAFREKGIPTGSFGTVFNDPRNRTKDESTFVDLKYESRPLPSLPGNVPGVRSPRSPRFVDGRLKRANG